MRIQGKISWHKNLLQEKGSVAIEFSMVFIPFIISILFIMEMCRVAYLSSTLDLLLAESGHIASISTSPERYQQYFNQEMNKRIGRKPLFTQNARMELSILYCDSISALASMSSGECSLSSPEDKPLAMYSIRIDYKPLLFIFPRDFIVRELSRRIALVQEFQNKDTGG